MMRSLTTLLAPLVATVLTLCPRHVNAGVCLGPQCPGRPSWNPSFPPFELVEACKTNATCCGNPSCAGCPEMVAWLAQHTPPMKAADPTLSAREKQLARLSATEFVAARRAGSTTCEEYARVLVKRMEYYKYMAQFMYWESYPNQTAYIIAQAAALDRKAAVSGVEAIAPLYCLPVPVKGTVATTDFPSSAGVGALHEFRASTDAALVTLLREASAVIMGKTNVPEFACSWVTANYANGRALNPMDHALTTGGSSGGAASAVATYIAPLAISEDTGGSTRHPALQQGNFGYDPSRNHYPNAGNPGLTYLNDQLGLNARSLEDILLFDQALLRTAAAHAGAAARGPNNARGVRVGLPRIPFVEHPDPRLGTGEIIRATSGVEARYQLAASVLAAAGATLVRAEWTQGGAEITRLAYADHDGYYSAPGQMAAWVQGSLGAAVSNVELVADMVPMPLGHDPGGCFSDPAHHGAPTQSEFRGYVASRAEVAAVWNSYFDARGVDVIMTPAQLTDAISYADMANASVPIRVDNVTVGRDIGASNGFFTFFKSIPVPKLSVPLGLDPRTGRPVGVLLWGRAQPPEQIFNDSFARTFDLPFLYTAKALVAALHAEPSLRRANAPLVADLFPPTAEEELEGEGAAA
jgi:Asp-tRNA(Asn)/Glu-tRNA(Gln) amidotransferase A subunit family amidase